MKSGRRAKFHIALQYFSSMSAMIAGVVPGFAFAQATPSAYTTGYRWDAMRRLTGIIRPAASGATAPFLATRYTYDANGQLVLSEDGYLASWQPETVLPASWSGFSVSKQVAMQYDIAGNKMIEATATAGNPVSPTLLTQFGYDADDRLTCIAERMNPTVFPQVGTAGSMSGGTLPTNACTLGTQGSQGPDRITQNFYDAASQLQKIQKALGTAQQQNYAIYTYTLNGKLQTVADANNNLVTYVYDGFDRQIAWIFPSTSTSGTSASCNLGSVTTATINWADGTSTIASGPVDAMNTGDNCEKYTYDANGNQVKLVKRDGSVLYYEPDGLNRTITKLVPSRTGLPATDARSVYFAYDLLGRQLSARFDSTSGEGIVNAYDALGRLTSTTNTMDSGLRKVPLTISFAYDSNGNRTRVTHPDGVYFQYAYDNLDRMINAWWTTSGGTTQFVAISYDSAGRRSTINRASSYTDYTYDGISRLASLTQRFVNNVGNVAHGLSYNPASQITQRTESNAAFAYTGAYNVSRAYTVNGLNQYNTAGSASFSYDGNGNLTSDGSNSYLFDNENRLVNASGGVTAALRYDPLGRLYEVAGSTGTTRFLYAGDQLVGEYATNDTLLQRYMWGPNPDEVILWDQGSLLDCSGTRFLHTNHQGSIIAAADCWGNQVAVNTYDEAGIPGTSSTSGNASLSGTTNVGRFQYTGQAWIPELGMYYYKARMYSPTLNRFMQTDPIGYKDQMNLYAYVQNDPVDHSDPTGLWTCGNKASAAQCDAAAKALASAAEQAKHLTGSRRVAVERAISAYGAYGRDNGVVVQRGSTGLMDTDKVGGKIVVTVNGEVSAGRCGKSCSSTFVHEGAHVADFARGMPDSKHMSAQQRYNTEARGAFVEQSLDRVQGRSYGYQPLWAPGMTAAQMGEAVRYDAWNKIRPDQRAGVEAGWPDFAH